MTQPTITHRANEAARTADRETAEAFANLLRDLLGVTPDMPRFHQGRDQHRRADQLIRRARERVQGQVPLESDDAVAAGYSAACAWHRFIYLEKATGAALEYVQNLTPWAFCQFLGDLVAAGVKTGRAQDRFFCELATRVTTAARVRSEAPPAERLAQQRTEILHLADRPHLSDHFTTIAPYSVWITYRLEAGASEHTWEAAVSGYRVLPNKVVDMDAASITLRSTNPFDLEATPEWLTDLIEKYAPSSW
ncbi:MULTISPECIES: hypothetical protein [Streptomyces]|uniref:Uncharacterized protein n=1 Tax=Streptomyces dengpaensis TaxID=2049881 RepID=A0ABN5IF75_9ACTN|nr:MULTISPECIES: hypothetical protein [Streptomyces]AVH61865.1 hypothetical protein C4B68_40890 [Streptomyces dengpaensis]PIB04521.1 hypothetical protein B1C81_32590 [Streptomyces sp. HG99]